MSTQVNEVAGQAFDYVVVGAFLIHPETVLRYELMVLVTGGGVSSATHQKFKCAFLTEHSLLGCRFDRCGTAC